MKYLELDQQQITTLAATGGSEESEVFLVSRYFSTKGKR